MEQGGTFTVLGKTFYYYLIPKEGKVGLFQDFPISSINNQNLLVCFTPSPERKLFTLFDTYLDFANFRKKIHTSKDSFYEYILSHVTQKPHFDIDIDNIDRRIKEDEANSIVNQVIIGIRAVLMREEIKINLDLNRDILIYSSHGLDKWSFHLLVNNYCHVDNNEAKAFYDEVIIHVDKKYQDFIDRSVYSKKQQFRILGSHKIDKPRYKKLIDVWDFNGTKIEHQYDEIFDNEQHKYNVQLGESLVTNTYNCTILPRFVLEDNNNKKRENGSFQENYLGDLTDSDVERMMELLKKEVERSEGNKNKPYPFKISGKNGGMVTLKRLHSSYCRACGREHEHENPYMYIDVNYNVYFDCRRNQNGGIICIGNRDIDTPDGVMPDVGSIPLPPINDISRRPFQEIPPLPITLPNPPISGIINPINKEDKVENNPINKEREQKSIISNPLTPKRDKYHNPKPTVKPYHPDLNTTIKNTISKIK